VTDAAKEFVELLDELFFSVLNIVVVISAGVHYCWAFSITYASEVVAIPAAIPMQKLAKTGRWMLSKPMIPNKPQAISACRVGEFMK